jgi:hypothetical protein
MDAISHNCCSIRLAGQRQALPLTIKSVHKTAYEVTLVQDAQNNVPPESQLPQDLVIKPLTEVPYAAHTDRKETEVYTKLSRLLKTVFKGNSFRDITAFGTSVMREKQSKLM